MKCPECGYISFDDLDSCKRCGTDWTEERARLGRAGPYFLFGGRWEPDAERDPLLPFDPPLREGLVSRRLAVGRREQNKPQIRWGGFLRRACAFSVDLTLLSLLSVLLIYFLYVGYSVGLEAHGQAITSPGHIKAFLRTVVLAVLALAGGYFVLFHGMEGQTPGKWLLGVRVVDEDQGPISYSQAFVRWVGYLLSSILGLGFLWILFDREKRGWHDRFAHTRVIRVQPREVSPQPSRKLAERPSSMGVEIELVEEMRVRDR